MIAFAAAHLIAGLLIGARFRFLALLPAFVVVVAESIVGDFYLDYARWYVLLAVGLVCLQVGYAVAAKLKPARRPAEVRPFQASTPK